MTINQPDRPKIIFITGPTASGKSALAIWLAKKIGGEIINADARQVYRGLNSGSGKITRSEQQAVPHHLLSLASPKRNYSLGRWLRDVDRVIRQIQQRQHIPIVCGGTILYLRALQQGWVLPPVKPNSKLRRQLEQWPLSRLLSYLKRLDPARALTIDRLNRRRLIRSIEIALDLKTVPPLLKQPRYDLLVIAPLTSWSHLQQQIQRRLRRSVPRIVREIRQLNRDGLSLKRIIAFGLWYRWFGLYVKGQIDRQTAIASALADTYKFAKRQLRELKQLPHIHWCRNKHEVINIVKTFLFDYTVNNKSD